MKYHVGCGKRDFGPEWVHVDGADYPHIKSKDVFLKDVPSESATLIYCSHMIEYFDREEVVGLLKEWYRVLLPFGKLRIAVPDFATIVRLYSDNKYPLDKFLGLLYGKMELNGKAIYHKTVYDYPSLKELLNSVGFGSVIGYDWGTTDHANFDDHSQAYLPHMHKASGVLMSLNVEATK